MEVNNDNSVSTDLSNYEEKEELLNEISMLKANISLLESMIETPKFGQLKFVKKTLTSMHDNKDAKFHIPNVQTELCYELYRFVGLRCREFVESSRLVFEICSTEQNVTENDVYAVEILINENGRGKLGKWVLPMSIDVQEILSKYPINNLNIKHFVKTCKHHVDCYFCRLKQFKELQDLVSGIKNIRLSHNFGITSIELVILGIKDVDADKFYNIILHLYYKSATARPYKLFLDTDDDEKPSPILIKKLNKYFKCFLKKNLNSAFLQISESQSEFIWQKNTANDNEDIMEIFDKSDGDKSMGFLTEFLYCSDEKKQKKNKDKVQNKGNTLHENEMESSLSEVWNCENINVTERNDSIGEGKRIKSRKRKQLVKTIVKPRSAKTSQADLKRLRNRMSSVHIEEESDGNITDTDYHIEHIQMKDNYNRKKGLLKITTDKDKKIHKELLNESSNSNSEHSVNSQKVNKTRKKRLYGFGQTENKKKYNILNSKRIVNSTPLSKKMSNKAYVFHEMSSIRKNEDNTIKNKKKL